MENHSCKVSSYLIELLRAVLHGQIPPTPPIGLDLNKLYQLAAWHSVANMAYYGLVRLRPMPSSESLHPFLETRNKALLKEARQELEVEMILTALEKSRLKCMVLKGYIIKNFYPQPDMRLMADADILVEASQLAVARDIMISLGYSVEHAGGNHDVYHKKPVMNIELHRALISESVPNLYAYFGAAWDRAKLKLGYGYRYELSPEDYYIYLLGHMAKHFRSGGTGIRSIMDVWVYNQNFRGQLDWKYINAELRKAGLYEFSKTIQSLSEHWFNGKAGNATDESLAVFVMTNGTYGTRQNSTMNKFISEKKESESFAMARVKYILRILFPNQHHMTILFPFLQKMPVALPVCWALRGMRVLLFRRSNLKPTLGNIASLTRDEASHMQAIQRQAGL